MNIVRLVRQSTKLCLVLVLACLLAVGSYSSASAGADSAAAAGFHVSGRLLLDANGNNFVMRGINHMHTWFPEPEYTSSFKHIKAKGANTVRVVLSSGQSYDWTKNSATDVANVITLCKTNKLVCILEVHDTTGYGESSEAVSLAESVKYWKEIKSVLIGQEAYVIINLGNEPYGNVNAIGWVNDTKNAILAMRTAGFQHMLMVDAPNWGQDWEFIMHDNAASIFNGDPLHNTVFSIHMYGVFEDAAVIKDYLLHFVNAGLPLVIGEFGWKHSDGNPNEDAIMAYAQKYGIGYLGWAWSGNCCNGEYLDMVKNFDPNRMTWWGYRIIGGENGICPTSVQASVYGTSEPARVCSLLMTDVGVNDGWTLESSETSNQGGSKDSQASTFNVGDDAANRQYRAILHFKTSALPNNAVITRVRLKVKTQGVLGTNPFTTHGGLRVDIRKPYFGAAVDLAANDFQALSSRNAVGTIAATPVNGWYGAVLGSPAFPYIDLTGTTQLRLRFVLNDNNDLGADVIRFYSGDAPIADRPMLIVEYTVP